MKVKIEEVDSGEKRVTLDDFDVQKNPKLLTPNNKHKPRLSTGLSDAIGDGSSAAMSLELSEDGSSSIPAKLFDIDEFDINEEALSEIGAISNHR